MSEKLTVIFPIETMVRELDFRLILAALYAQPHHRFLLAHASHATRLATKLPGGGLYVGKTMGPTRSYFHAYQRAKENGFVLVHLAEEGAVFMGDESTWGKDLDLQLDPKLLSSEDYVATWGDVQRDYYLEQRGCNRIKTTGHPRFDIYKGALSGIYALEAERLKQRFGKFVLYNSNLQWALNPLGHADTFSSYQGYFPTDDAKRISFVERWTRQMHVFPEFVLLLNKLAAKRKDLNFVVRPHPSDSLKDFQDIFRGIPNVHVVREGSVVPWILASSLVLHDGCTTGIEAYMMGKPIVNFTPIQSEHEIFLPNLLGIRAWNQAEAESAVNQSIDQRPASVELPERAHRVFANFKNDSMQLFLNVLHEAESGLRRKNSVLATQLICDQAKFFFVENSKHVARKLFFEKRYQSAMAVRVLFPGFNPVSIAEKLQKIGHLTGRYLEMKRFSPWLIELNLKEVRCDNI